MPKAEGEAPHPLAYLVAVRGPPPLSLRDISPRKGGRGDLGVLQESSYGITGSPETALMMSK